ncbi:RHS repeat domain-containing protein [Stenotrophomonas rhizophila]|uniref:RHS repeat domain-containing protein n=1 Tax=Stenotrophomonas rhizophila TaxID=216778 RepID=UPI003CCFE36B
MEVTDENGRVTWSESYKPQGLVESEKDTQTANPSRFQGQHFDTGKKLRHNRQIYYDPKCDRFISKDPAGFL